MKINKILLLSFVFLISLTFVLGAQVCCEKVKNGGFCENTDSSNCEAGLKNPLDASKGYWSSAATSCALTNFCRVGSCFNPNKDGLCYANYPKSSCEAKGGVFDASDPT